MAVVPERDLLLSLVFSLSIISFQIASPPVVRLVTSWHETDLLLFLNMFAHRKISHPLEWPGRNVRIVPLE